MSATFLGIEIGGTKLQLVAGHASGRIVERRRLAVDPGAGGAGIREQVARELPSLLDTNRPAALGAGFGGPVDWRSGCIRCSHQVEGWSDFPLADWLGQQCGLPVRVDNDANTAALGEACCGAGSGFDPVFYITLGSGVGGGMVVDRRIYHGTTPGEAEIGHLRLDRAGTTVESRCSGWAVDRRIREARTATPHTLLSRLTTGVTGGEARFLAPALEADDPDARRILDETADDLAFALSHVTHLVHPAVVVLGGGLSLLGEPLRRAVEAAAPRYVMSAFVPGPPVRLAALGEDAVPVGALLLAREAVAERVTGR